MITEDEATRLLRRADPARFEPFAPVVDAPGYLAALRTRSTPVTLIDSESTQTQPNGRHRWSIIAAAAAIVAIVVGALLLVARDDSETVVPAATTVAPDVAEPTVTTGTTVVSGVATSAEQVVRGFLDAYVAKDADQALTYLADDLVTSEWGSADDFRRRLAWTEASGYREIITGCEPNGPAAGSDVTVRCAYDLHGFGSEALGLGPYVGHYWNFTVRDGKIVEQAHTGGQRFSDEVWGPFARWIRSEHPDDVLVMYSDSSQTSSRDTDEGLRLWEQRTEEYVQAVLTRRETLPADVAAICANQAAQLGELALPAEGALDQVAAWATAAATILREARGELNAIWMPPATDTTPYSDYFGSIIVLIMNLDAKADAADAGNTTRLAELDAEYVDVRQGMSSGPAGSGLEECVASLPN